MTKAHDLERPYSSIARIYDQMMDHVDYAAWSKYLVSIFQKHHLAVDSICEFACGTGSLAVELEKLGYRLWCSDNSPEMIHRALEKSTNRQIDFSVQDMLYAHWGRQFDAALCLYDSVNYLMDIKLFNTLFANVFGLLRQNGLFIFDICTEANSERNFRSLYEEDLDAAYRRRSYYIRSKKIQVNEIELLVKGRSYNEIHYQKIYSIREIEQAIENSEFTLVDRFANMTLEAASERSDRIHFVLQKN